MKNAKWARNWIFIFSSIDILRKNALSYEMSFYNKILQQNL